MNDTPSNPYLVVGSPNYATPVLNMFGGSSPTQGQQANQQNKPGQPTNTSQPNQQQNFYQLLMKLFGGGGAGQPMQLGSNQPDPGTMGGTGGGLGGLY